MINKNNYVNKTFLIDNINDTRQYRINWPLHWAARFRVGIPDWPGYSRLGFAETRFAVAGVSAAPMKVLKD